MMEKQQLLNGIESMRKVITEKYKHGKNGNGIKIIKESPAHYGYFFVSDTNINYEELKERHDGMKQFVDSWK